MSIRHAVREFRCNPSMTIGDRIRQRRKALDIEVEALAKAVGLKPSTLYDLENGRSKSTTKLHALARELGCTAEWLETGHGHKVAEPTPLAYVSHDLRAGLERMAATVKLLQFLIEMRGGDPELIHDIELLGMAQEVVSEATEPLTDSNLVDFGKRLAAKIKAQGTPDGTQRHKTSTTGGSDLGQDGRTTARKG